MSRADRVQRTMKSSRGQGGDIDPMDSTSTSALPRRSSLEEKLELLEDRFTKPISSITSPQSGEESTVVVAGSVSSPTAFNPHSCSSQHSFSFDSVSVAQGGQHGAKTSRQPLVTSPANASASLEALNRAADRHMAKVAATSMQQHSVSSIHESLSSSASNPTRLTGHLSKDQTSKTVQESPPAANTPPPRSIAATKKSKSTAVSLADVPKPSTPVRPASRRSKLAPGSSGRKRKNESKGAKRKSVPMKRDLPSVKENFGNKGNSQKDVSNKRARDSRSNTPLLRTPTRGGDSHSRDNKNGSKHASTNNAKTTAPPPNNTLIYDFFKTAVKKKGSTNAPFQRQLSTGSAASDAKVAEASLRQAMAERVEELEQRCHRLEQVCNDRDSQLKAVSNNRTILHSALQSALTARERELEQLKSEQERDQAKRASVVEELVRNDATRQAKELRERLAVDGARLGRIVHTRAGMRSVETWEDGHASKHLRERKKALLEKRAKVEERYQAATKAAVEFERKQADKDSTSHPSGDETTESLVGGILVESKLDAAEAVESSRFHLASLSRQEKEIAAEEQKLNDEKMAHIRALKRVASEDASRFRSRPKLHDRYILRSLLGKGGFSEVWRAYDLVELREVAVKIHQLDPRWHDAKKENYTKHVSREYEIHRKVRHPRIVSLFDVFEIDNNSFATVLECCDGTDLDTLLKDRRQLPEREARAILLQILLGMKYLSQPSADGSRPGIIHYDLKPGNVLFDSVGDAKITDFGLSKIVDAQDSAESMELTSQGAGTYWYLPPECFVFDDTVRISSKVDVWSIGVIFYQMLFAKRPFGDGQSQDRLLTDHTMLNARQVNFPPKPQVSDECKSFIRTCLTYEQSYRPTIAQLCDNRYILSHDF